MGDIATVLSWHERARECDNGSKESALQHESHVKVELRFCTRKIEQEEGLEASSVQEIKGLVKRHK